MTRSALVAALLATVATGAAWSQTAPATDPAQAAQRDGSMARMTRADYVARADARFTELDVDKDGTLSRKEQRADRKSRRAGAAAAMGGPFEPVAAEDMPATATPAKRAARANPLDANGDGTLTRAEYDAGSSALFKRADANGDGRVDAAEAAALPRSGKATRRGDTDGDGILTSDEYAAGTADRFAKMDGNGDGVIDAVEMGAGRKAAGGRRSARSRSAAPAATTSTPSPPSPTDG